MACRGRKGNVPIFFLLASDASTSLISVQIFLRLNPWDGGSSYVTVTSHFSR
jgi:hypothetical protein